MITVSFCYVDNYISPLSIDFFSDSFFQVLETFQFVTPSIIHHDPRTVTLLCPIMVIVTHQHMLFFGILAQISNVCICCYSCHIALVACMKMFVTSWSPQPSSNLMLSKIQCFPSLLLDPNTFYFCACTQTATQSLIHRYSPCRQVKHTLFKCHLLTLWFKSLCGHQPMLLSRPSAVSKQSANFMSTTSFNSK